MTRSTSLTLSALAIAAAAASCGGEFDSNPVSSAESALSAATLTLAPQTGSSTNFGSLRVGDSRSQTFVLANTGTVQSTSAITVSLSGHPSFSILAGGTTCAAGAVLGHGASCLIQVRFTPSAIGGLAAILSASATVGGSPSLVLTGTGSGSAPLVLTGPSFFPTTAVGQTSAPLTYTLTNTSAGPTGPITIRISGTNAAEFILNPPAGARPCLPGSSLPPHTAQSSCTIQVSFAPTSAGAKLAQLSVTSSLNAGFALTGTAN